MGLRNILDSAPVKLPKYVFVIGPGKYVGMDNSSGGYPHITDQALQVKVWHDIDEAKKYRKMFDACDQWQLKQMFGLVLGEAL